MIKNRKKKRFMKARKKNKSMKKTQKNKNMGINTKLMYDKQTKKRNIRKIKLCMIKF